MDYRKNNTSTDRISLEEIPGEEKIDSIAGILGGIVDSGRIVAYEHEAYEILRLAGLDTPDTLFFSTLSGIAGFDADSFPGTEVICKIIATDMPHRTEYGGVRRVECSPEALSDTFTSFERICGDLKIEMAGMMVAQLLDIDENVPRQLLVTIRQDPSFGPVLFAGIGGTGTEVWGAALKAGASLSIATAADILNSQDADLDLEETLFYPIVTGRTRITSTPMIAPLVLTEALKRLASLAIAFSRPGIGRSTDDTTGYIIDELEINPLQITDCGRLVALDSLMRISPAGAPRHEPPASSLESMLKPSNVLVIGASAGRPNMGRIILNNLQTDDGIDKEQIFVLHPFADEIDGAKAVRSPADVPGGADLTVFTIPASDRSISLLEEIISQGLSRSIVLISGGFDETEGGKAFSERIKSALDTRRISGSPCPVINGPNCMGIYSGPGKLNTFFLPEYKVPFRGDLAANTAVISQSGAWLVTLLSTLGRRYTPRYMITVGNQIDLTITDHLAHLSGDEEVRLFVLYIEGFIEGDGERFLSVARDIVRSGRKVLIYKTGRTAAGAAAAASHTAAMATDHDLFNQLVTKAGLHESDSLEDIEDAVRIFTLLERRKPSGNRVAICSDAGFECSVAADRLYSLKLARFAPETSEALSSHLPGGIVDIHNPVDTTPAVTTAEYGAVIEAIIADQNTDIMVVSNVAATATQENLPAGPGHDEDITRKESHPNTMIRLFNSTDKPFVVCINEGSIYDAAAKMMEEAGIPVFRKIDRAMRAMDLFVRLNTEAGPAG